MNNWFLLPLLLLLAGSAGAQPLDPPVGQNQSVSAFLQGMRSELQLLSQPADSARWAVQRQQLTRRFVADSLTLPNTLVPVETYLDTRPTVPVRDWIVALSRRFWGGSVWELDQTPTAIRSLKQPSGVAGAVVEVEVSASVRGIFTNSRQAHRLRETWLLTLVTQQAAPTPNDWQIRSVRAVAGTVQPAPLTRQGAVAIRRAVQDAATDWLAPAGADSLRQRACARLRSMMTDDSIFVQTTDKEIRAVAIDGCRPPILTGTGPMRGQVVTFSLTYLTDFYRPDPDSPFTAHRTRLDAVRPDVGPWAWYTNRRREVVPVSAAQAAHGPYCWTVSRLIIHL